jgi:hypothetical protein
MVLGEENVVDVCLLLRLMKIRNGSVMLVMSAVNELQGQ